MKENPVIVLLKAYAEVLFIGHPVAGLVVLAVTFINPNIGITGLLGATVGLIVTRLFRFPNESSGLHVFNSMLVGLSLGAFYEINLYIIILVIIGSVFTVFLTVSLSDSLWRLDRLPVLSLPFILVAAATALVAQQYSKLNSFVSAVEQSTSYLYAPLDNFFISLGSTYFTPHPLAGLLLFICLFWRSRYLALLGVLGYIVGQLVFGLLADNPHPNLLMWTGFNFVLTAVAIGGYFFIPGFIATVTAMLAVTLTALLIIAIQNLLFVHGLPVLALPFVLTVSVFLMALRKRTGLSQPWVAMEPGLPEVNAERARLAQVRNGDVNSVPLLAPFLGQWCVYQGFNGRHTHKTPWQHALDFYIAEEGKSFHNEGKELQDYFCFGVPVLSPAHGQVIRTYSKLADNRPGDVDVRNNWGNFILIRLDSGFHVLLAHLMQESIQVTEGDRIKPGQVIAACGNSGRSPQPHLHLQVQQTAELGSPTCPFHLASIMLHNQDGASEYRVVCRPEDDDRIEPAAKDELLAAQLHMPVGRQLSFLYECPGVDGAVRRDLRVDITLLGQFRLLSDSSASVAFEENNGVLAFYDRQGPDDVLLDMFVLANGLTPLTESARQWRDSPSASLLPLTWIQKAILYAFRPLGCGIDSQYQRNWDMENRKWVQTGKHRLMLAAIEREALTESLINPDVGFHSIRLDFNGSSWRAELIETGIAGDRGIPGWHSAESNSVSSMDNNGQAAKQ